MRLYVSGFPPSWQKEDFKKLCETYGKVVYAHIRREKHAQGETYGVVQYNLTLSALEAKLRLDGAMVGGYTISVKEHPPVKATKP